MSHDLTEPRILKHRDMVVPIPTVFKPFNPADPVRIYTRSLPHLRQAGATYFVTFRLVDSVPDDVWMALQSEAVDWRERVEVESRRRGGSLPVAMEAEYAAFQQEHLSRVEGILDSGHGSCLLARAEVRRTLTDTLLFFQDVRYRLHGLVVMPNHVHLCVTPAVGWELEDLIKSWKGFSSRQINLFLQRTGSLWQSESYDRIVRDVEHFARVMRYMGKNPQKAGLRAEAFSLWLGSSRWLVHEGLPCREDEGEYGSASPW